MSIQHQYQSTSTITTAAVQPINPQPFHQESSTQILLPPPSSSSSQTAFINPVQEFNRDLSIAAIRAWHSIRQDETRNRAASRPRGRTNDHPKARRTVGTEDSEDQPTKRQRTTDTTDSSHQLPTLPDNRQPDTNHKPVTEPVIDDLSNPPSDHRDRTPTFTALEALSATGLRAIRYAKEIPSMRWIIANDLSPSAVSAIRANIRHNGLEPERPEVDLGKVRVNQGDACDLMYSHRNPKRQFDLVDIDPYGTAAPFMDAAVQCVRDGGLLCITCTDLAVLAGSAYPEKCFSNYGGSSLRAEYSHEYALRQVLHAISSSASRYGRQIKPLLSLSIDFYVRIFVRVFNSPVEVKKCITKTSLVYVCSSCSAYNFQSLGRSTEKSTKSGKGTNVSYHHSTGPPVPGSSCEECGGKLHVAGPLWSGPLHDQDFMIKLLEGTEDEDCGLKTVKRIKGMVEIAKRELVDSPFFFTPSNISKIFHCTSPSLVTVASALLNGGYQVSRSHCQPGSIKTDAPRKFLYDIMRKWIESNPVKLENIKEGSPGRVLLSKPITFDVKFDWNEDVENRLMSDIKVVRYQSNPEPNWGPKSRATAR
ncbi:tRNA methyltransferase [Phakopsora pachyrhizi]|nr:tRNA methyltransferase [Phakopsora pachyrhizi]